MFVRPPIVLEIGSAFTRAGFGGDAHPRHVDRTALRVPASVGALSSGANTLDGARTHALCIAAHEPGACDGDGGDADGGGGGARARRAASVPGNDLERAAHAFLRRVYFQLLHINPPERRIVLTYSHLTPRAVVAAVRRALVARMHAPALLVVPSSLAICAAYGAHVALVVDLGAAETRIVPVYAARVANDAAVRTTPRSAALAVRIARERLVACERAVCRPFRSGGGAQATWRRVRVGDLCDDTLVSTLAAHAAAAATTSAADDAAEDDTVVAYDCTQRALHLRLPRGVLVRSLVLAVCGSAAECGGDAAVPLSRDELLARSCAPLAREILECVARCAIDTRYDLLTNVIFAGGGAALLGAAFEERILRNVQRILQELQMDDADDADSDVRQLCNLRAYVQAASQVQRERARVPPALAAWIGASLVGTATSAKAFASLAVAK